jgi:cytochrome d ubiquinol oxidase subunit I
VPNVFIQYWSMRVMAYLAAVMLLFSLWGAWLLRKHRLAESKWFLRIAPWAVAAPFLMNTAGWMLAENGRQPWIVQGLMKTVDGVSPNVTSAEIWISLIVFVLIYIVLGAADAFLMIHYGRKELGESSEGSDEGGGTDVPPGDGSVDMHDSESDQSERVPALIY